MRPKIDLMWFFCRSAYHRCRIRIPKFLVCERTTRTGTIPSFVSFGNFCKKKIQINPNDILILDNFRPHMYIMYTYYAMSHQTLQQSILPLSYLQSTETEVVVAKKKNKILSSYFLLTFGPKLFQLIKNWFELENMSKYMRISQKPENCRSHNHNPRLSTLNSMCWYCWQHNDRSGPIPHW